MNMDGKTNRLLGACVAFLMICAGPVSAGAPAPRPDTGGAHTPDHQIANLGDFRFESGEIVKDFKVSYVTHGTLNENKDNVVLVMQGWGGDHHNFDHLIGPGQALDTDKYFIVATDMLGNARLGHDLTTGPTNSGLGMDFPNYSYLDSVTVEYRFLKEYLGFDHILAAMGISIGGMKAYQFAVSYPDYATGFVPIVGTPLPNWRAKWVLKTWMDIIALDSGWHGGNYDTNPLTGIKTVFMSLTAAITTNQWYSIIVKSKEDYHAYKDAILGFFMPQDARDMYYQTQAWAEFNIGDTPGFNGDAEAALRAVKARVLIIAVKEDPIMDLDEAHWARDLISNSRLVEIESAAGHFACCVDPEAVKIIDREIAKFLADLQ